MTSEPLPLHWSTRALERVSEAVDYVAQYDAGAVDEWVDGLFEKVERLSTLPRMGRVVPEVGREAIREVFYKRYRIIYKLQPERVEVLTVRHMSQQFDAGELGEPDDN